MKYLYNPPALLKKIFSDFQWESENGKILLTFDDGPSVAATEIIVKTLKENNIRAAFFCVGNNVKLLPDLTKLILGEGHLIGNHTYNHKQLLKLNLSDSVNEINSFTSLLNEQYNYEVKYFRPPHGKFKMNTGSLVLKCGLTNVMWSLLTYDYRNDLKTVKLSVEKYLKRHSIVVLHDSMKSMNIIRDSINIIIDTASKKGFYIGEPEECLK